MYTMTTERFNFITRDEFNAHEYKTDQKFDNLTEIMLREFDKVDTRFGRVETRLDSLEIRMGTLSEDVRDVKLYMKNTSKRLDKHDEKFNEINQKLDAIIAKAHISPAL